MTMTVDGSSIPLPFLEAARAEPSPTRSPLEEEVAALFDSYRNPLLRYLRSFGLLRQDAEEIVQEVFFALFRHLHNGKSRSNLRGWIFRVGHNMALKQRARNYQHAATQRVENAAESQLDPRPGPEEQLANEQQRARLLAVVRALPEQDRFCLYLRAEGLRYREIAEALGISLGGVSLSLGRSLARLARTAEQ